ncbi:MAG: family 20 glycosylhydrolase [Acidobacteriota bacterium]
MKSLRLRIMSAAFFLYLIAAPASARGQASASPSIIPRPAQMELRSGYFDLIPKTKIIVDSKSQEAFEVGEHLAAKLRRATGFPVEVLARTGKLEAGSIVVRAKDGLSRLGTEGYLLTVTKNETLVEAAASAGLFYGVQTFLQLLPPEIEGAPAPGLSWSVPCVKIEDQPRFSWRGVHLDVGRHFFSKEFIKKYLDVMAMYKMNTFHWHLTEDQGWRIEIKKHPRLTEIGAWRRESMDDLKPHGGFYTQDDIREVVAYAKKLHIAVVPEIEMPGHCQAALAAYPELSCSGGPLKVGTEWGVIHDVYCAGKEKTFEFLQDVLVEVIDLFPGEFIHIGGDEVPKTRWKNCFSCQERMKAEGLASEEELQSYFIKRMENFLRSKGKRLVGWDEILEGGLAPQATVMSWRGIAGGVEAARSGHDAVMSPTSHCYFDYFQGQFDEPRAIGGFLPIDKVYSYEPVPAELSVEEAKHILGAQANVWTEYQEEPAQVEYMLLPRMLALSEVVWSKKEQRSLEDFSRRLVHQYDRLAAAALNFRLPPPEGLGSQKLALEPVQLTIRPPFPEAEVRYTIDGRDPTRESPLLPSLPIEIKESAVVKARTFLRSGRMSRVISTGFSRVDPEENGLDYSYYEGSWWRLPDPQALTPAKTGQTYSPSLEPAGQRSENFALLFTGFLHIERPGDYEFTVISDDGASLVIDGKEIIRDDGLFWILDHRGKLTLDTGLHPIQVLYFQKTGGRQLEILCEGPGWEKRPLPAHWLFRK